MRLIHREIKFRAWHPKYKKFYYDLYWTRLDIPDGWLVAAWYRDIIEGNRYLLKFETKILQQYTGLKDRNNQDIYEGDIITDFNGEIGVVTFTSGCCTIVWEDKFPGYPFITRASEVIGNIYEKRLKL